MTARQQTMDEIGLFLEQWQEGEAMKTRFAELLEALNALADVELSFVSRPGVSYSLRPRHPAQKDRHLFAMVDVIDDDPTARWLSVCFYGDMITDPEERGELIPGGLAGDDGYCFDMFEDDPTLVSYLKKRLNEAFAKAAS